MRVLLFALMLLATPAAADDWGHYENARYGYAVDVPPGFAAEGESDNGDGQVFSTPTAQLSVFGGYLIDGGFEEEVILHQQTATDAGWAITYQATTPRWASFSGTKGGRIMYERLIPICGDAVAAFVVTYGKADLDPFNPIVERLVQSLKSASAC